MQKYLNSLKKNAKQKNFQLYIDTLYEVDTLYRKFYYYFDKVDINEDFKLEMKYFHSGK